MIHDVMSSRIFARCGVCVFVVFCVRFVWCVCACFVCVCVWVVGDGWVVRGEITVVPLPTFKSLRFFCPQPPPPRGASLKHTGGCCGCVCKKWKMIYKHGVFVVVGEIARERHAIIYSISYLCSSLLSLFFFFFSGGCIAFHHISSICLFLLSMCMDLTLARKRMVWCMWSYGTPGWIWRG